MKIIAVLASLYSLSLFSQHQPANQKLFTLFDQTIGIQNTDLSYGTLYLDKYRVTKENHPFLDENKFQKGKVNYQLQTYYEVLLKYELVDDQLILNFSNNYENRSIILEKGMLSSFSIGSKNFIKDTTLGYLEVLHASKAISILKKNQKNKKKKLNEAYVYYKFLPEHSYYLNFKGKLHPINKKKDLLKILPNQKELINSIYKSQKKLLKQNTDTFYALLSQKVSTHLISQ